MSDRSQFVRIVATFVVFILLSDLPLHVDSQNIYPSKPTIISEAFSLISGITYDPTISNMFLSGVDYKKRPLIAKASSGYPSSSESMIVTSRIIENEPHQGNMSNFVDIFNLPGNEYLGLWYNTNLNDTGFLFVHKNDLSVERPIGTCVKAWLHQITGRDAISSVEAKEGPTNTQRDLQTGVAQFSLMLTGSFTEDSKQRGFTLMLQHDGEDVPQSFAKSGWLLISQTDVEGKACHNTAVSKKGRSKYNMVATAGQCTVGDFFLRLISFEISPSGDFTPTSIEDQVFKPRFSEMHGFVTMIIDSKFTWTHLFASSLVGYFSLETISFTSNHVWLAGDVSDVFMIFNHTTGMVLFQKTLPVSARSAIVLLRFGKDDGSFNKDTSHQLVGYSNCELHVQRAFPTREMLNTQLPFEMIIIGSRYGDCNRYGNLTNTRMLVSGVGHGYVSHNLTARAVELNSNALDLVVAENELWVVGGLKFPFATSTKGALWIHEFPYGSNMWIAMILCPLFVLVVVVMAFVPFLFETFFSKSRGSRSNAHQGFTDVGVSPAKDIPLLDLDPKYHPLFDDNESSKISVAFSGGGIRSCSFMSGVLQLMVEQQLMDQVDALSTVSGGAYCASAFFTHAHSKSKDPNMWTEAHRSLDANMCDRSSFLLGFDLVGLIYSAIIIGVTALHRMIFFLSILFLFSVIMSQSMFSYRLSSWFRDIDWTMLKNYSFGIGWGFLRYDIVDRRFSSSAFFPNNLVGTMFILAVSFGSFFFVAFCMWSSLQLFQHCLQESGRAVGEISTLRRRFNAKTSTVWMVLGNLRWVFLFLPLICAGLGILEVSKTITFVLGILIEARTVSVAALINSALSIGYILCGLVLSLIQKGGFLGSVKLKLQSLVILGVCLMTYMLCFSQFIVLGYFKNLTGETGEKLYMWLSVICVALVALEIVFGQLVFDKVVNSLYETRVAAAFFQRGYAHIDIGELASVKRLPELIVNTCAGNIPGKSRPYSLFTFSQHRHGSDELGYNSSRKVKLSSIVSRSGAALAYRLGRFESSFLFLPFLLHLFGVNVGAWFFHTQLSHFASSALHTILIVCDGIIFAALFLPVACAALLLATNHFVSDSLVWALLFYCVGGIASTFFVAVTWRTVMRQRKNPLTYIGITRLLLNMMGASSVSNFAFLSDGGHIDNLGLLSLLRRRDKFMFIFDAGENRNSKTDDLQQVLLMAKDDGLIESFAEEGVASISDVFVTQIDKPHHAERCVVTLKVKYPDGACGIVIYARSILTKKLVDHSERNDEDMRHAATHVKLWLYAKSIFPFHPTSNQFFNHLEYMAYRDMGRLVAEETFKVGEDYMKSQRDDKGTNYSGVKETG
mmetsp:Transcript_9338/g.34578  ORF Transcript_9338/g.34578 Transcript_9338/m.34578 type:complete len:1351 (-) Transcript_9338:1794-5846(-)